jgi:hypothetical protein
MSHNLGVPITIIRKDLKGATATIRENEQRAGNRVGIEPLPANLHQPVNAFAIIPSSE